MSFQASVASFRAPVLTALVLLCSTCAACGSDSPRTCVEPLDPAGAHYGRTAGEWLADWSRWLYETPASQHPVTDTTGEHCAVNQPGGEVFYLVGTYGGPMVTRTCAVPAGSALFVPFLVWFNDNGGVPMPVPDEELRQFVEQQLANGVQLSAELDGCQLSGLERHKTSIEEFSYDCPEGDCIYSEFGSDFSGHVEPAYSGGYALLLPPLEPGRHQLQFAGTSDGGTLEDPTDDFTVSVRYHLTIE